MKETPFTLPVCIRPAALTVLVKLVTDAHCAEKIPNTREFIFLEVFHRRFTMKTGLTDRTCVENPWLDFQRVVTGGCKIVNATEILQENDFQREVTGGCEIENVTGKSQASGFKRISTRMCQMLDLSRF